MAGASFAVIGELLKRGVLGLGFLKLVSMVLSMLASILVARNLGAHGYGQVVFVISVLHLLALPASNALTPLIVRQVSSLTIRGKEWLLMQFLGWSSSIAMRMAGGMMLLALLWIAMQQLQGVAGEREALLLIGGMAIFLWAMAARITGILQGLNRVVLAQSFDWLLNPLIYLLLLLILWYLGSMSPLMVLLATLGGLSISVVVGVMIARRMLARFAVSVSIHHTKVSGAIKSEWFSSWRYFVFLQFIGVANGQIPVLMLGGMGRETEVGLFRAAENVASLLSLSLMIVNSVIAPRIASLSLSKEKERLEQLVRSATKLAFVVTVPLIFVIVLWGKEVLSLLFGPEFVSAYGVILVLVVGHFVNVSTGSVALLLNMTGNEARSTQGLVVAFLVNLLACALLVPLLGMKGASIGAALSMTVWNLILFVQVKRYLGIRAGII